MKALMSIITMIALMVAFNTITHARTCSSSYYIDATGTVKQRPICFIKVKNSNGSSLSNGELVSWDAADDDGISVRTVASAGLPVACVVMESISDGKVGKCQVYGYHSAVHFESTAFTHTAMGGTRTLAGSSTPYELLYQSVIAGDAMAIATGHVTYEKPFGVALDAVTSDGTIEAFIEL